MIRATIGIAALLAMLAGADAAAREKVLLDDGWSFALQSESAEPGAWQPVHLPHTWNAADSNDKSTPYHRGVGVYRRTLRIDPPLAGRELYLYFEGANQVAEVFVNGREAGRHVGGYTAFAVDIGEHVDAGADNLVEVRVDNRHDDTIPPLNADFTFYGGLYRDVWLLALDEVHFELDEYGATDVRISTESLSEVRARIRVSAGVRNTSTQPRQAAVAATVTDADGNEIARSTADVALAAGSVTTHEFAVVELDEPTLWSPESPYLYGVTVTITESGDVLDSIDHPLGLRRFEVDAQRGFLLNGEPYRLYGSNRHQDREGYGNALPDVLHRSDLRRIRDDGFNFLRLAHYPQDPAPATTTRARSARR